jgi:hypothetical protein
MIPIDFVGMVLFAFLALRGKVCKNPTTQKPNNCHNPKTRLFTLSTFKQVIHKCAVSIRHAKKAHNSPEHGHKANERKNSKKPFHIEPPQKKP